MYASRLPQNGIPRRRVVITGIGLVSPVGIGVGENWANILAGKNGVGPVTKFDASNHSSRIAAELKNFDPLSYIDKKEIRKMDPFIQYAVAAASLAIEDAAIDPAALEGERTGVYVGSGIGGIGGIEETVVHMHEKGPGRVSPYFLISTIINEASGQISIRYKSRGPNLANATACASSAHSIGDSSRLIARGDVDMMIAGGSEAPITPLGMAGFCAMRALSQRNDEPEKASRPFDAERDGFIVGEGAAILLLEELEHALKRGAKIYAEIVGYGMSGDAYHASAPCMDGTGAYLCMKAAVKDARINPEDVDYVNAHGTSTPWNDKIETLAIKKLFGEHAHLLAISSTKSMVGHLLGAAGGIEAAFSALSLRDRIIPPTINYEYADPDCDLDYVPNKARQAEIVYALSNSFGFGGTNGSLVFKRFDV
ncbi:MAG: beta-ketoacyl-ACP synthase II [Candidatus Aminicenantes bacterium]|nr:beta-ketoacyl-ACP synthase II [Candidatus Aminicenantes bacterium]